METESSANISDVSSKPRKERDLWDTVRHIWNNITLEPLVLCFVMPSMLLMLGTQNLNLEKACRVNLAYNASVCDSLTRRETANYLFEEKEVQKLVARMTGWKTAIHSAVPCLIILFVGSWSDRHARRKPCILIPLVGEIITAFGLLFCVYFENTPIEFAIFVEVFFPSITGSRYSMMVGIFSYLADVTTEKERTFRIGIVSLVFSLAVPFGMAFSGILLRKIGFYGVFTLAGLFYVFAFCYGLFFLKEVPRKTDSDNEGNSKIVDQKSFIADFFNREHALETFRVAFKSGERQRRLKVILLMVVVVVIFGPQHGEMSLFYLFTRYRFNWSEVEFSFFSTYSMATHLIGTLFSVAFLSKILKVHDALIGAISTTSKILTNYVYAFASLEWHMFIGPLFEIVGGAAFIAMRSLASKMVSKNELGKVNSLFSIVESFAPLVYSPLLAAIYTATINTMPGAFFLVGGTMTIPGAVIFIWLYALHRKEENATSNQDLKADIADNGGKMVGNDNHLFVISDEACEKNDIVKRLS